MRPHNKKSKSKASLPDALLRAFVEAQNEADLANANLEAVRTKIKDYMLENQIEFANSDMCSITLVTCQKRTRFDSKRLKKEMPMLWKQYASVSISDPYIRTSWKK